MWAGVIPILSGLGIRCDTHDLSLKANYGSEENEGPSRSGASR